MSMDIHRTDGTWLSGGSVTGFGTAQEVFFVEDLPAIDATDLLVFGVEATVDSLDTAGATILKLNARSAQLDAEALGLRAGSFVLARPASVVTNMSRVTRVVGNTVDIVPPISGGAVNDKLTVAFAFADSVEVEGGYWEGNEAVFDVEEGVTRFAVRDARLVCGGGVPPGGGARVAAHAARSAALELVLDRVTIFVRSDESGAGRAAVFLTGRHPSLAMIDTRYYGADGRPSTSVETAPTTGTGATATPRTIARRLRVIGGLGYDAAPPALGTIEALLSS